MLSSADLFGQVNLAASAVNSARDHLSSLRSMVDYPHSIKKRLKLAREQVTKLSEHLAREQEEVTRCEQVLDPAQSSQMMERAIIAIEDAHSRYTTIRADYDRAIGYEKSIRANKPDVTAFLKMAKGFTQEELRELLKGITTPAPSPSNVETANAPI